LKPINRDQRRPVGRCGSGRSFSFFSFLLCCPVQNESYQSVVLVLSLASVDCKLQPFLQKLPLEPSYLVSIFTTFISFCNSIWSCVYVTYLPQILPAVDQFPFPHPLDCLHRLWNAQWFSVLVLFYYPFSFYSAKLTD